MTVSSPSTAGRTASVTSGPIDAGTSRPAALAKPPNLAAYGNPDAADLAAAYAYGVAGNHGFLDGIKRTAWAPRACSLAQRAAA